MTNASKRKGTAWEVQAAKLLNEPFEEPIWKRVPLSGAIGTTLHEPELASDVKGKYPFIPFRFVAEAKTGYGGSNMQIKKEWFDKIKQTADQLYAEPLVFLKFLGARSGAKHIIAMEFDTWNRLMLYIEHLTDDRDSLQNLRHADSE